MSAFEQTLRFVLHLREMNETIDCHVLQCVGYAALCS